MPAPSRLALAAAHLCVLAAATGCGGRAPRDPVVEQLVDRITHGEQSISWVDEDIVEPTAVAELIRLGPPAIPTLLDLLSTTTDSWTQDMLLEAIGRIGDPRAREPLEQLLARPTRAIPDGALTAIARLGRAESIPAVRARLARPDRGGRRHAELLGALLRLGDESVVEELIDLGWRDPDQRFEVVEGLVRYAPLRAALGLDEATQFIMADDLCLKAAKEWALERRGEPSPWKARDDFAFREPFAAEKQQAFALVSAVYSPPEAEFRFLPVDVATTEARPEGPVAVLFGWGHSHDALCFEVWQPRGATARLHRFSVWRGEQRSAFAGDSMQTYYEVADVPVLAMQRAIAGMRAALATRVVPWWHGPDMGSWMSTANFAVCVVGATSAEATVPGCCDYPSSDSLPSGAPLAAARDWHLRTTEGAAWQRPPITDDSRALFAQVCRRCRERWDDDKWWWVRERIVAMAGAFGDASLVPILRDYLQPRFADGKHSLGSTAAGACTALSTITGIDLRFADGKPRPVADVAKDYLDRLAK